MKNGIRQNCLFYTQINYKFSFFTKNIVFMRKYAFVLLWVVFACNKPTAENRPVTIGFDFNPNTRSVIRIQVRGIRDSVKVYALFYPKLRQSASQDSLLLTKDGTYDLSLYVDRPAETDFSIGDTFWKLYMLPADTNIVQIIWDAAENKVARQQFGGNTKPINEYLRKRAAFLHNEDRRFPINAALNQQRRYETVAGRIDSTVNSELAFLSKHKQNLPEWYYETEKADIIYLGASLKFDLPQINSLFNYFKDTLGPNYYDFLNNLAIDNPPAVLSAYHALFLSSYCTDSTRIDQKASGYTRLKSYYLAMFPKLIEEVNTEARDAVMAEMLSAMLPKAHSLEELDSLLDSHQTYFTNRKFYEFMKGEIQNGKSSLANKRQNPVFLPKGSTAPAFELSDSAGTSHTLSSFEGKTVYLSFWASWCKPCIAALPDKKALARRFANHAVVFVNISIDGSRQQWLKALRKHKPIGVNLFAGATSESLQKAYLVNGIPHYVLIDRKGSIHANATDAPSNIVPQIESLLK